MPVPPLPRRRRRTPLRKLLYYIEFDVVYRCMAAASEEATRREVRYCGICKADKEAISVKNISQIEKLMTLACQHKIIEGLLTCKRKFGHLRTPLGKY